MGTQVSTLVRSREAVRRLRADLNERATEAQRLKIIGVILDSYPGGKKYDGLKVYVRQLETLLDSYPFSVCMMLAHPKHGVAGMVEGYPLPSVASVKAIAEQMVERKQEALARALSDEAHELRIAEHDAATPAERAKRAEMLDKLSDVIKQAAAAKRMENAGAPPRREYFGIGEKEHEAGREAAIKNLERMRQEGSESE